MQRILQPGEIEALDRISFPRVRLPEPVALFADRAARLRQLATGHAIGDYLRFVALLADAQSRAAGMLCKLDLIAADAGGPSDLGAPAPAADNGPSPAWREVLRRLIDTVVDNVSLPIALVETAQSLSTLDDSALDHLGRAALADAIEAAAIAKRPFVMAALQVDYAVQASRLDRERFACGALSTLCPVCGGPPVSSVLRVGGSAGGHRYLHCGTCATEWHMVRVKCSHCETTQGVRFRGLEGSDQVVLAETCDQCGVYLKQVNQERDQLAEPLADDLASLVIDLLMADTKFARVSGNPMLGIPG